MSRAAATAVASAAFFVGAMAVGGTCGAQPEAPGQLVAIEIPVWGQVVEVSGRFGVPASAATKTPAVLILHGSGGVDGRGAYYAKALQEAGIATLEINMFSHGNRPRGSDANMPHVAAALKWLAEHPTVDGGRIGVMGFSWGGRLSVLVSSETVQARLGSDVPKPAALVARALVNTTDTRRVR